MDDKFCTTCRFCQKEGHTYPPNVPEGDWHGWLCRHSVEKRNPVTGAYEGEKIDLCVNARGGAGRCGVDGQLWEKNPNIVTVATLAPISLNPTNRKP